MGNNKDVLQEVVK